MGRMTSHILWKIKAMLQTTSRFYMFMLVLCVWCKNPGRFGVVFRGADLLLGTSPETCSERVREMLSVLTALESEQSLDCVFLNLWEKSGHSKVVTLQ
jgi:hypothetical protein